MGKGSSEGKDCPKDWSPREAADAAAAEETNDALLLAVRQGDARGVRRAIEEGAGAWLGSPQSRSADPSVNPVLAALLGFDGSRCLDAFDQFFGDVRSWGFERWLPIHWAVAGKSEDAVRWCLRGREQDLGVAEEASEGRSVRRSALAICVEMGDPEWLARALGAAAEAGCDMSALIREDARSEPCALGVALWEWAGALREGRPKARCDDAKACALALVAAGFGADSRMMPASKLVGARALADPKNPKNAAMAPAARLAAKLGKGSGGPFARAGAALDADWAESLAACGLRETSSDRFGAAASERLLGMLRDGGAGGERPWGMAAKARAKLEARMEASLRAHGGGRIAGLEPEALGRLAKEDQGFDEFVQKVELAIVAGPAAPSKGPAMRL